MKAIRVAVVVLLIVFLTGCSLGAIYPPTGAPGGGPHPQVSAIGALHHGPVELSHSAVSNSTPATDLTTLTVNAGPTIGPIQLTAGLGWQLSRMWGACDSEGFNCDMTYTNGWVASGGITYRQNNFRADLKAFTYDNSPVGKDSTLPLGVESLVLLFGFDL